MDLTWQKMVHLQMLCMVVSTSCIQGNDRAKRLSSSLIALSRFRRHTVWKQLRRHLLRRHLLSLQENETQGEETPGHKIHRVRRSWLSEYLDDLWSHVRHSFPRGALYAFPVALVIVLLLCCATVLME